MQVAVTSWVTLRASRAVAEGAVVASCAGSGCHSSNVAVFAAAAGIEVGYRRIHYLVVFAGSASAVAGQGSCCSSRKGRLVGVTARGGGNKRNAGYTTAVVGQRNGRSWRWNLNWISEPRDLASGGRRRSRPLGKADMR